MAIIQISKLQQISGNLVDLPQLDEGEMGWASDEKRLFIGKTVPSENIEVLTTYSNINLSQVSGTDGTDFNLTNPANGEVLGIETVGNLAYIVNKGGTSNISPGGLVNLGNVANIKIGGGALGYVLETDGLGNLSWTSKGTLLANIVALSNATPIIMTVANTTPYVNTMKVTITGVQGTGNSIVNGNDFFIELAGDFPTSGNVSLYTDASLTTPAVGTGLAANANTGIATTSLTAAGTTAAAGSNGTVQFNSGALLGGDSDFTYNNLGTKTLTLTGNITTSNINVSNSVTASRLISNVATGTAPLSVSSTTLVANLNADLLDGYSTATTSTANTVSVRDSNASLTANLFIGNGSQLTDINGSNVSTVANANYAAYAGNVTLAAQSNITSLGTLASLSVTGNISSGNANLGNLAVANYFSGDGSLLTGLPSGSGLVNGTSNVNIPVTNGNINVSVNGSPNIFVVTASGASVAGNLTTTNITTGSNVTLGNITGNWLLTAGSQLEASYADLAEYYEADQHYAPGTVLEFGGDKEVTIAQDGTTRVAGVVSTNPAYAMNANCRGIATPIALQGRVPTKVRGTIRKGDMMVSGGNGFARPWNNPQMGMVIGKALENFDGVEGVIEIAIGRL
jgi:hypothetical protein